MFCFRTFGTIRKPNKMAAILFRFRTFGTIRKPNKMAAILLKKLNIYVQTMMLTIRNPNHSETEHCVRISNVIRKPNHSPMEHLSTIRNPNVFGIRAPTVFKWWKQVHFLNFFGPFWLFFNVDLNNELKMSGVLPSKFWIVRRIQILGFQFSDVHCFLFLHFHPD